MPENGSHDDLLINQQQLRRMIRSSGAYPELEEIMGQARASRLCEVIFESELSKRTPGELYIAMPPNEFPAFDAQIEKMLRAECAQIKAKRAYVEELIQGALAGQLHEALDLPEPQPGRQGGYRILAEGIIPEIQKASVWIAEPMHNNPVGPISLLLRDAVEGAAPGAVLGPDTSLLTQIHRRVAPEAPRLRGPNPETTYPSNVGGMFLLEEVFERTAGAEWPRPGDVSWYDVALLFLAVIGTVQGFPDGNKRVARCAYAVTLLRNRCFFIEPSREVARDLFRMGPEDDD